MGTRIERNHISMGKLPYVFQSLAASAHFSSSGSAKYFTFNKFASSLTVLDFPEPGIPTKTININSNNILILFLQKKKKKKLKSPPVFWSITSIFENIF